MIRFIADCKSFDYEFCELKQYLKSDIYLC